MHENRRQAKEREQAEKGPTLAKGMAVPAPQESFQGTPARLELEVCLLEASSPCLVTCCSGPLLMCFPQRQHRRRVTLQVVGTVGATGHDL